MDNKIIDDLFLTKAVRVSEADKPFWYTSGTLGPFFINTHFLYGSEADAQELLSVIESGIAEGPLAFPALLLPYLMRQYEKSAIYKRVIDLIVAKAQTLEFDFVSGGERRDFFFSLLPAYLLKKPHLSIFKSAEAVYSDPTFTSAEWVSEVALTGKRALHIVDLVTEAASYTRLWIPTLRENGAEIDATIAVVDRCQSGRQVLADEGITLYNFASISPDLFETAKQKGEITLAQLQSVLDFMQDPRGYMQSFLASHPGFIAEQLALGGKTKEKVEIAIAKGLASAP